MNMSKVQRKKVFEKELLADISGAKSLNRRELMECIGDAIRNCRSNQNEYGDGMGSCETGDTAILVHSYEGMFQVTIYKMKEQSKLLIEDHPFFEKCVEESKR